MITVKGIRTNCFSGKSNEVEVDCEKKHNTFLDSDWVWIVRGGVTGYESIEVSKLQACKDSMKDWVACSGTKGVWDNLVIPISEVFRLVECFCNSEG